MRLLEARVRCGGWRQIVSLLLQQFLRFSQAAGAIRGLDLVGDHMRQGGLRHGTRGGGLLRRPIAEG